MMLVLPLHHELSHQMAETDTKELKKRESNLMSVSNPKK
jgi:hypothetical protein